ncbi:hypothetical protein ANANG_G00149490 [Anguilla anguilla]|uniref:Uncharacterized protein n=1 Tax=Anguilla anguilla TaxID=7936 RepID=A0A9D3RUD0_ANGAN|nr:hypothetical protein ANANG_G00149490 [Anguilla anguilla]
MGVQQMDPRAGPGVPETVRIDGRAEPECRDVWRSVDTPAPAALVGMSVTAFTLLKPASVRALKIHESLPNN